MKKVLITGGAGFIGKELTRNLLEQKYKLFVIDNLLFNQKFISNKKINNYKLDITDKIKLIKLVKRIKPDIVIHLAAIHSIPICERDRQSAQKTNIIGTENLLEATETLKIKKFIHASTGGIYGWNSKLLVENLSDVDPSDNYSLTKFSNERQIHFWGKKTLNKYVILRIFNTIGPNDPNGHLIPDILNQLDKKKKVNKIYLGNIKPKRDYIDTKDVAKSISKIIKLKLKNQKEIINICNQTSYSIKDILNIISKEYNTKINVGVDSKRIRKVDRPHQTGSNKKLVKLINYKPTFNLQQSLKRIINNQ
jgi:UDP-glucose 4-epimerase